MGMTKGEHSPSSVEGVGCEAGRGSYKQNKKHSHSELGC